MIKYNSEIKQPGKVIGHETTVCKMDDGQKRNGRAQPPPVRADADLAGRQHVRAWIRIAHSVVAGRTRFDRDLFPDVFAQRLPPAAGKRRVSASALQGDERVARRGRPLASAA